MRAIFARLKQSADLRTFSFGLIWSTLGTIAARLTPVITTVLISHWFGIEQVGQFAVTYGTLVSASLLASAGVSLMATRNVAAYAETAPDMAGRLAGMALLLVAVCGMLLATAIFAFAEPLATMLLKQPDLEFHLKVIAPIVVVSAVNTVQIAVLTGLQEFKAIARLNMIFGALMIVAVPSALYFYGLIGSFIGLGAAYLTACFITLPTMLNAMRRRGIGLSLRGSFSEWPMITRYALPALLASLLFEPVNWICTTMVVNNPDGLQQIGVYYIAMQLETLLLFVPQIVVQVIIPMLSTGFGVGNRKRVLNTLGMGIGTNVAIAIGFVGFMALFGDWFLRLFNLDPQGHQTVFLVVVLTAAVIAAALPLGQVPVSSGYVWTGLAITAGWATTFIIWTWLLQDEGAIGLVIARAIAWCAQTLVYIGFTRFAVIRTTLPNPVPSQSRIADQAA